MNPTPFQDPIDGDVLLSLARGAVAEVLLGTPLVIPMHPWLQPCAATFVTIRKHGELHGCIGSIRPVCPLGESVCIQALNAALHDPRSRRLQGHELADVRFEVSLLGPLAPMPCTSEQDACRQLCPGTDGVVLSWQRYHGVFLPQVWESLPTPREFLLHLKRKAGLPGDFWEDDVTLERFTVTKWHENGSPE